MRDVNKNCEISGRRSLTLTLYPHRTSVRGRIATEKGDLFAPYSEREWTSLRPGRDRVGTRLFLAEPKGGGEPLWSDENEP